MRPFVRIFGGGMDLTGGLSDRLLSVEVTDVAEDKSDSVSITLDDRARWTDAAMVAIPAINMQVTVVMGYLGGGAATWGPYLIDDIEVSSPPREMRITGKAAAMGKSYRTPRTQSYHQKTLGAIMQEIAGRNGYQAVVDGDIGGIVIRHADQHNESDMAFATRIAEQFDAVARPAGGRLVVAKRGAAKAATGQALAPVAVSESDCSQWSFRYSARDEAGQAAGLDGAGSSAQGAAGAAGGGAPAGSGGSGSGGSGSGGGQSGGVRAFWADLRTGERKPVEIGQAPFHDLRYTFQNEAEATAAAQAYLNKSARGNAAFSCTIGGRPSVQAEAPLILAGFRPYIPAAWRIKTARHVFDGSGGYTTSIDAELFEESQGDVSKSVAGTKPGTDDQIDPDAPAGPIESTAPDASTDGDVIHLE